MKEGIDAVLRLARGLAERRDGIIAQEELNKVAALLRQAWNSILGISICQLPWHQVSIEIGFLQAQSEDTMNGIAGNASQLLARRDKRFVSEEHLTIGFHVGEEWAGSYSSGGLLMPPPKTD